MNCEEGGPARPRIRHFHPLTCGVQAVRRLPCLVPSKKKAPRPENPAGEPVRETGGALLSRAPGRSTIAAEALNGRVRDGNGCVCLAMATGQEKEASGSVKP